MNIRELRVGCHVLCGSIYKSNGKVFQLPHHYAEVVSIGEDWVDTVVDKEQGDPDEYSPEEVEGIPLTEDVFLCMGFKIAYKDKENARYVNDGIAIEVEGDMLIIKDRVLYRTVDRPKYLHTLEGMLVDIGYNYHFDPYENKD